MLEGLVEGFLNWRKVRSAQNLVNVYECSSDVTGRLGYNKSDYMMTHEVVEAYLILSLKRI